MMELLQLRYFCDAAITENFSQTASKYYVPTSCVSQAIKRLEGELGCELFDHRRNRVRLNDNGKLLFSHASRALSLLDDAKTALADSEAPHGEIRIVCLCNRSALTRVIERYNQQYPQVSFVLHHGPTVPNDYDILISDVCPHAFREKQLFIEEKICLAMRRDHPLATVEPLSLGDLAEERFITMTSGGSLHAVTLGACTAAGFSPNIAIQTDDPFYVRKYVELGLGIALVPMISWQGLFDDSLLLRPVGNITRSTYAYLPKDRYIKTAVRRFLEILETERRGDI